MMTPMALSTLVESVQTSLSIARRIRAILKLSGLSLRQYTLLHLQARGLSVKELSDATTLGRSTVNAELAKGYDCLGVKGFKAANERMYSSAFMLADISYDVLDRELGLHLIST